VSEQQKIPQAYHTHYAKKSRKLKCQAEIKKFLCGAEVLRLTETSGWAPLGTTSNSFGMAPNKRMSQSFCGSAFKHA